MADIIHAPEGVEIDLAFYLTSDATGLEMVARIGGLPALTTFDGKTDANALAEKLSIQSLANDWRLMSRAEIADYKRREREGDDE